MRTNMLSTLNITTEIESGESSLVRGSIDENIYSINLKNLNDIVHYDSRDYCRCRMFEKNHIVTEIRMEVDSIDLKVEADGIRQLDCRVNRNDWYELKSKLTVLNEVSTIQSEPKCTCESIDLGRYGCRCDYSKWKKNQKCTISSEKDDGTIERLNTFYKHKYKDVDISPIQFDKDGDSHFVKATKSKIDEMCKFRAKQLNRFYYNNDDTEFYIDNGTDLVPLMVTNEHFKELYAEQC